MLSGGFIFSHTAILFSVLYKIMPQRIVESYETSIFHKSMVDEAAGDVYNESIKEM